MPLIVHPTSPPPVLTPQEEQRRSVRGYILFFFAMVVLLDVLWTLRNVLEIVYVSALFAVVLTPIVQQVRKLRIFGRNPSRAVAVLGLVIVVFLILALFFILAMPPVLHDIEHFSADLPSRLPAVGARLRHLPLAQRFGADSIGEKIQNLAATTASYIFASAPKWMARIMDVVTAGILCVYFMLEGEYAYQFFLSLFPTEKRQRLDSTLKKAERKISKWLVGQGILMLILGVASTIVFGLLHVRYFVLLGFLMGLFNIIPIAGGVITIVLAAGVAALDSWTKMTGVLIFYLVYVNLENAVLIPRIMRSSVNLMGLTVLVALLLGTALAGIVGALVSVPTAALIAVLLEEYAVQKN